MKKSPTLSEYSSFNSNTSSEAEGDDSSSTSLPEGDFSKDGYLKQRTAFTKWNTFFFTLESQVLQKFKRHKKKMILQNVFHLNNKCQLIDADKMTGKKYSFCIIFENKETIFLMASNEHDKKEWMNALKEEIGEQTSSIVATIENMMDAAVIADYNCVITSVNTTLCNMFGYTKEELIGERVDILMPMMYASMHGKYVENYHKTGEKRMIGIPRTLLGKRKDGTTFPILLTLGEVEDKASERLQFIAIIRHSNSITKKKNKDEEQKDAISALQSTENKLRLKINEFMHKIQNALTADLSHVEKQIFELETKIQVLTQNNAELRKNIQNQEVAIKQYEDEISILHKTSDKYAIVQVLRNEAGFQAFMNFCKDKKQIPEACMFWRDAEKFRTTEFANEIEIQKSAHEIFNKYFRDGAPCMLAKVSNEVKEFLSQRLNAPGKNMFVSVQHDILFMMKSMKIFEQFSNSGIGKAVIASLSIEGS